MQSVEEKLVDACYNGDDSLVQSLIEDGVNINSVVKEFSGMTPLTTACKMEHTNIVKLLLENGAQVNLRSSKGESALMMASSKGNIELAHLLIEQGALLNLQDTSGNSALIMASCRGYVELAKVLIDNGAQVNLQDSDGDSALTIASWWNFVDLARVLLDCGAQVNLPDIKGKSALLLASLRNNVASAKLLLEYGADANLKSKAGSTPFMHAKSEEMINLLMLPSVPQFIELLLPIAHKWRDLGIQLGLDGATLNSFQTTIEEEESCLQAVMTAWSKRTHPQPTWSGLIRAVESVDATIGQRMNNLWLFCNDDNATTLQHVIKTGKMERSLAHGVITGPAGSGKSSLISRLVGEIPTSTSPSTGVANRVIQVEPRKSSSVAVNVPNNTSLSWLKLPFNNEATRFLTNIILPSPSPSPLHYTPSEHVQPISVKAINTGEQRRSAKISPVSVQTVAAPLIPGNAISVKYPSGYVASKEFFKTILNQEELKLRQHFENSWSLYLTDTGGQMEFQEVLPLLVSGPSIFFITFRLDQELNQRFTIEYRLPDGGKSEPYESSLTVEEAILQTLASVASMGTFTYKGPQMKSTPLKPIVLLVGTHKDKLDKATAESKIKEIDQYLQSLIRSTSHYRDDLVEFSCESQLVFTVNNLSEDDSDFKKIRSSVVKIMKDNKFKISYPSRWLFFSLMLRQQTIEHSIISFDQCFTIAQDCGIVDHEELNHALWFLHSQTSLIRHFPTPDLKDVVIRDPQILFDQITHLIVKTFTFENVRERRSAEFKKKGIFSFEDFKKINQTANHFLPPEKFLLLLEQLRIVAPFQTEDRKKKYFIPCVLAHSEVCTTPVLSSDIPPLLIIFKCGYCPKGLAGALIVYLLNNEMGSKFKWQLKTDRIFRDQVSFLVSQHDFIITLNIHSTFLECRLFRSMSTESTEYSTICNKVRCFIEKGIEKIADELNFTADSIHSLSFFCQDTDCVQRNGPHPATDPQTYENGPCIRILWCKQSGNNTVISCPPAGCSVWFEKEYHQDTKLQVANVGKSSCCMPRMSTPTTKHHKGSVKKSHSVDSKRSSNAKKRLRIKARRQSSCIVSTPTTKHHKRPLVDAADSVDSNLSSNKRPRINVLSEKDLKTLVNELRGIAYKWLVFGQQLGVSIGELQNISANPMLLSGAPVTFLQQVLYVWLNFKPPAHPLPTVTNLCESLSCEAVGEEVLATQVRERLSHKIQPTPEE